MYRTIAVKLSAGRTGTDAGSRAGGVQGRVGHMLLRGVENCPPLGVIGVEN
jgi:hypothetical protein